MPEPVVPEKSGTVERLHEVLIDLERSRRRERELRLVESSLFDVVRVLALAEDRNETFRLLLETLREVLGFDEAAIFLLGERGISTPVACTCEWFKHVELPLQQMLRRVNKGQIVVTFDASVVPEWRQQPVDIQAHIGSVIHIPLRTGDEGVILVCTHSLPARFEQRHVNFIKRLVPLVGQILQKLDLREALSLQERERQERLAMFNAIVSNMREAVLIEDGQRRIFAVNDALRTMLRISASVEALIGTNVTALDAEFCRVVANPDTFEMRILEIIQSSKSISDEEIAFKDARIFERDYVPVSITGTQFIAHFWQYRDITARRTAEGLLHRQASRDTLTDLSNRPRFIEEVNLTLRDLRRSPNHAAVLYLDLDRFKLVNDRLGHAAGDQLLIAVADRLRQCVREVDMVARLGGDEFTILLTQMKKPQDAVQCTARIIDSLSKPFSLAGENITITISIGIAVCKPTYSSAENVMRDADIALYRAKAAGKNCFHIFDLTI